MSVYVDVTEYLVYNTKCEWLLVFTQSFRKTSSHKNMYTCNSTTCLRYLMVVSIGSSY